jgi:hypothetical protein
VRETGEETGRQDRKVQENAGQDLTVLDMTGPDSKGRARTGHGKRIGEVRTGHRLRYRIYLTVQYRTGQESQDRTQRDRTTGQGGGEGRGSY